ncbi:alpha/beta fold hydrolase, partial [Pseudofrankia sp. EUN1h]|uniref:alpha/beta fold hydrolase n=2 Tax=Pseudofrankia TaxID=2994363 RepID=UPI0008DA8C4F
ALAERYRVYVPERRGHGHTPDVEGAFTTEAMAGDTIAFLESLHIGPARLVGWSDGALVGVRVALRRPDLVRKLVLIGQYLTRDGATAAAKAFIETPAVSLAEIFGPSYALTSPDGPDHLPVFLDKLSAMWRGEPDIELAALGDLAMPVLVLQGDDDAVRIEHSLAVARALPDAQLAVVPCASHALPVERPALLNQILMDFLADEQPAKFMPLGALADG